MAEGNSSIGKMPPLLNSLSAEDVPPTLMDAPAPNGPKIGVLFRLFPTTLYVAISNREFL
jgi:hypothetical protein